MIYRRHQNTDEVAPMNILSLHDGHNASACLLEDGRITRAVQEERMTGVKNQPGFPDNAIRWILDDTGLAGGDLDRIVYGSWSQFVPLTREEKVKRYKEQARLPSRAMHWIRRGRNRLLQKSGVYEPLKRNVQGRFDDVVDLLSGIEADDVDAVDHHRAHAASAYYGSPWAGDEECLVLTLDGSGDGLCATVSVGRGGELERISETPAGNSLGDIYSRTTHLLGFVPLEHEFKLMGMAPYVDDEERVEEAADIFRNYLEVDGLRFRRKTRESTAFVGPRLKEDLEFVRFDWVSAGLQRFTEELIIQWIENAVEETGIGRLCLAGGTFMNVKANGDIAKHDAVEDMFVCPSSGDESLPLGAAYLTYARETGFQDLPEPLDALYLGPRIESDEGRDPVEPDSKIVVKEPADPPERVAELLAQGEVVARAGGAVEFGARALGNRSIFVDPSDEGNVRIINQMIKMRDFWMPFAPILLEDRQDRYIENPKSIRSPHMMIAFETNPDTNDDMVAAVHPADWTARPQILERGQNPPVETMLDSFEERTGRAVLLNTSYNIHGEPIVTDAEGAVRVLRQSGLQWLWLGDYLLHHPGTQE